MEARPGGDDGRPAVRRAARASGRPGALDDQGFGNVGEETAARVRAERLDETLAILDGLWSGEPFGFDGDHYRFEPMTFRPRPVQEPRIPIWVVGSWPHSRSMRRAARWDGIVVQTASDGTPADTDLILDKAIEFLGGAALGEWPLAA